MIDLPGLGEDELRRRIRALTGADEGERVAALLAEADAALGDGATITATAAGLIEAIRGKQRYRAGINALLAEYSLSSREGVVLMCLAEALLRVGCARRIPSPPGACCARPWAARASRQYAPRCGSR